MQILSAPSPLHLGILLIAVLTPGAAWSQEPMESFAELQSRIGIGDQVRVLDRSGVEIEGRVSDVSLTSLNLTIDGRNRSFAEGDVQKVARRESLHPAVGATLGGIAGSVTGLGICATTEVEGRCVHSYRVTAALYGGIGAGLGVVVSKLIPTWRPVLTTSDSLSVRIVPLVTPDQKAVGISLSF